MPPLTSARRPRSGKPPRLMPTPSEPQPVPLHGGTNAGVGPLRVCAFDDAPASSRSLHGRRMVLADGDHQRGLPELGIARVDASRRARAAARSAAGAPVRAAVISAVSPPGSTVFGIDAGIEQAPDHLGVAVDGGEIERRDAVAIDGRRVRSGTQQRVHDVQTIGVNGGVQRGHAVDARRIDVNLLADERAHRGEVAARRRIDERRRRFGRARRCRQQQREEPCRGKGRASAQSQKHQAHFIAIGSGSSITFVQNHATTLRQRTGRPDAESRGDRRIAGRRSPRNSRTTATSGGAARAPARCALCSRRSVSSSRSASRRA